MKAICLILDDYALEDLYEILLRNGLALPMKGQHWLTKKLMLAMFRGEVYCPKFADLKPRPCPKPPTRVVLVEELNKEIELKFKEKSKRIQTTSARMPDQRWLLDALSSLNPSHQFFSKNYQPERQADPFLEYKMQQLAGNPYLEHQFFKGLPP